MTQTIAITTPTGNVGGKLASLLVDHAAERDLRLVLVCRHREPLVEWERRGARVHAGRLEAPEFLVKATEGVDALFWATPNSFPPGVAMAEGYRRFAESAATAIEANRIAHTVHLSGFAHVDDGGGERSLLRGLADSEAILGRAVEAVLGESPAQPIGITHLRAGFFFENILGQLTYLKTHGRLYLPVNRRRRIPMVASTDVARRAADILLSPGPRGRAFQGALGPEDLSFADVASALSEGLGRTIRVTRLPRVIIRSQMLKYGRDERTTDAFMLIFGAITDGKLVASPARDEASTTPTSMNRWAAEELKPLLEAGAPMCPARVQYEAA